MRKNRGWLILLVTFVFSNLIGQALPFLRMSAPTQAQEQLSKPDGNRVFIHGTGIADSSKHPPIPWERFTLVPSNDQRGSFNAVPAGKTFIVTDILYNTRRTRENLTVNFAKVTPDDKTDLLFQIYLKPGEQEETHLCTGYAIPSGYGLGAWTNANLEPEQLVQISITGYLVDEAKK